MTGALTLLAVMTASVTAAGPAPRLIVLVSVDQLPARYLTEFQPLFAPDGMFNRLSRQGAWFTNCHHRHAFTLTGPGHSTMMTGTDPARTGIIGNSWFDRRTGRTVNCVEDEKFPIIGGQTKEKGVSPRNLLVPTVGDALKLTKGPKAKVFGVSWKDRAGVLMAGNSADGVFWFDEASGHWVTSRYYRDDVPGYLRNLNEAGAANAFAGRSWELLLDKKQYTDHLPDDNPYEANIPLFGRKFPHGLPKEASSIYYTLLGLTPFGNELTLAAAAAILESEALGQDEIPDVLCVGLSANDYVGHSFGPHSLEVQDITARTDRQLAEFVDLIESKVKGAPWVFALSSDHGVAPIPEYAATLKLPAVRNPLGNPEALKDRLEEELRRELGPPTGNESYVDRVEAAEVFLRQSHPDLAGERFAIAQRMVQRALLQLPYVAAVHTRNELLQAPAGIGLLEQFRLAFNPARSGDVLFVLSPYCIPSGKNAATHGSPWNYDTHVPLFFMGSGIKPGRHRKRVSPAHIGPTLCRLLGIEPPAAASVEALDEAVAE